MKMDFSKQRVLAVVAHPDDAELLCAGTLARAKRDGAVIGLCVRCLGDKGQPAAPIKNLATVRQNELAASVKLLGATLFKGHCPDGMLMDNAEERSELVEIYRNFRPTLVLAHAPEDYHPDHRAASSLADAASWFCASLGFKTPLPALKSSPAVWWMDTLQMNGFLPGFYIDITDFLSLKIRMLACHRTQLRRHKDPAFSSLSELMRLQVRARGAQAGVQAAEAFRALDAFKRSRAW
jgi:LmbE family N-acetylglucosaminyl deacetylase